MTSTNLFQPQPIHSAYPVIKETMPQSDRGYKTNNKYPQFPPLMHDGRSVTASWQHDAVANAKIIADNNIRSNWEYRRFLTTNANSVMEQSFRESSNDLGYNSRFATAPSIQSNQFVGTSTPMLFSSSYENQPVLGRSVSDLKTNYLSREDLHNRQFSPVVTQDQYIKSMNKEKPVV